MNIASDQAESAAESPAHFTAKRYLIKWGLISLAVLIVLVVAESLLVELNGPASSSGNPRSFETYEEFITFQEALGYRFLGRFHDFWPAEVSEERTEMNEISFQLSNGTRHTYPKYDGYELKMVRLVSRSGDEGVVVLRSENRKAF